MVKRKTGPVVAGLELTLDALDLADVDKALIALARGLAAAVDADPCPVCGAGQNAALWREYRAALQALTEAGSGDADDDTRDFLIKIQTPRVRP